jgi:hypothetical protein
MNYPANGITGASDTPITNIDILRTKYNFAKRNDYVSYLTLNTALNEPNLGTSDVMKRDSQNMIVQQNTLYIIGTVTAATCLVLAIMFGYND